MTGPARTDHYTRLDGHPHFLTTCPDHLDFVFASTHQQAAERVAEYQICEGCPVRLPCLEAGITGRESGVWGGVWLSDRSVHRQSPG